MPATAPKVLIVDDEKVISDILSEILNSHGYICTAAYSGRQAVEKARSLRPDFVLVDMIMPDMNGAEVAEVILNEQPDCKIVFMTGQAASENLLKEKFTHRPYTLFHKPLHPDHLLKMLEILGLPPPDQRSANH